MPAHHAAKPLPLVGNGPMSALPEHGFHLAQLAAAIRFVIVLRRRNANRFSLVCPQMCVKPRKVNVSGLPSPRRSRRSAAKRPNSITRVFSACSSRLNLAESLPQFFQEPPGVRFMLEADHEVVRITHDDDIAVARRLSPLIGPQVKHVVQVEIGQQGRDAPALRRPFLAGPRIALFHHAGVQPFLDVTHDAIVRNPMLDELRQPFVVNVSKKPRMSASSSQLTFFV